MTSLQPSWKVTIYQDPITKTLVEGEAKLVQVLDDVADLEYWTVRFLDGTNDQVDRWIDPDDCEEHTLALKEGNIL